MTLRNAALALILTLLPAAVPAQSAEDSIVSQLTSQGFRNITVNRTLLGRVRIVASSDDLRREIVFNPATGEIIRDYWTDLDGDDRGGTTIVNPRGTAGQGDDRDDDDDDDDRDDNDDDDRDDDRDDDDDDDRDDDE